MVLKGTYTGTDAVSFESQPVGKIVVWSGPQVTDANMGRITRSGNILCACFGCYGIAVFDVTNASPGVMPTLVANGAWPPPGTPNSQNLVALQARYHGARST